MLIWKYECRGRAVVLKVRSLGQQHQHHSGNLLKMQMAELHPRPTQSNTGRGAQQSLVSLIGGSDPCLRLRTSDPGEHKEDSIPPSTGIGYGLYLPGEKTELLRDENDTPKVTQTKGDRGRSFASFHHTALHRSVTRIWTLSSGEGCGPKAPLPLHSTTTILFRFLNQTSPPGASKWFLKLFWEACQARCPSLGSQLPSVSIQGKPSPPPPSSQQDTPRKSKAASCWGKG